MSAIRYRADELNEFASNLLVAGGMGALMAKEVAAILVDGDLLGHTTHGLALLAPYLNELEKGSMRKHGEPRILRERPAAQLWDGERLPGPWLTLRAIDTAATMAAAYGTGTVVVRRSHHIACLASYLLRTTRRGLVALIESSDPVVAAVVPHGGLTPVMTPNPIAAGLPTSGDPIIVDVSTSITSMGAAHQRRAAGQRMPGQWLVDAQGSATDDPEVLAREPKGALLPLGGIDAGYKGFGLGLLIEAMTAGLAGHGRADPAEGWGGTVFVQVIDPEAFGGLADFKRQMDHMVATSHASRTRPGDATVRMPGERGLALLREQQMNGVALHASIMPALAPWAGKLNVPQPATL